LARRQFNAWTPTVGQLAGDRISDAISRPEVAFGFTRDIDDGVSTMQGEPVTWRTNVLTYLQKIAESDHGMVFASRENTLTYRDRRTRTDYTIEATFTPPGGGGLAIHGLEIEAGSRRLYNLVSVDREGGTLQSAEDTDSQTEYGIRSLSLSGLLMDTDAQAQSMAEFLLATYSTPGHFVSSIRVNLSALPEKADRALVASLDLGSVISVGARPLGIAPTVTQVSVIEGISHTVAPGQPHIMTFDLSPVDRWASAWDLFVLDDSLLDGDAVLAF
jgi:hypothetical protein